MWMLPSMPEIARRVGIVVIDSIGRVVAGRNQTCFGTSALHGEARALLLGVELANMMKLEKVVFESDSKMVVDSVLQKQQLQWEIEPELQIGLRRVLLVMDGNLTGL
ncbi:conserved hypothetical protein [Ricinus communis]|uniref:RNase H type-1 domain-containing protein n=1 Tax=Ricinus communis TaxID=3988 RepID=B9RFN3_RICCO|nr:conserved hypothetical protein [Ricinus communis]